MNDVILDLKNTIKDGSSVIVATSGGPDSMALLSLLLSIKDYKDLNIVCAHVNHKLRDESEEEEIMVKNYCLENDIIFELTTLGNYEGNVEESARKKRYEFFDKLVKKYKANYLLTAHHGDDLVETILMRLIRSSSMKGYAGFSKISKKDDYFIYRPLIIKTKDEILDYVLKNNIPYALDKSNDSMEYTRNRMRKNILPLLKEENKNVHLQFLKFSEKMNETEEYFNTIISSVWPFICHDNKIRIDVLNTYPFLLQKKIIQKLLYYVYGSDIILISDKHIDSIMSVINDDKPNKTISLPLGKIFVKEYNFVGIKEKCQANDYDFIFDKEVKLPNGRFLKKEKEKCGKSNNVIYLNSKDISLPIHVRSRKDGDTIVLKGLNKSKKIKDIFIDSKLAISERDNWPIVTDSKGKILWVPGLKKSNFDLSNSENYDIIIRYI